MPWGKSGSLINSTSPSENKKGELYSLFNNEAASLSITKVTSGWVCKIEAGSLDVGLLINTLYQSHKRAEILRESIRLLKKNGKLVIVEWNNIAAPFGPPPEERVKKELVDNAAKKLGLRLEDEFEAGSYHYGLIYIKL